MGYLLFRVGEEKERKINFYSEKHFDCNEVLIINVVMSLLQVT